MTQEMNKMFNRTMGNIRYYLLSSYHIGMKTWLACNRIAIWLIEHPKVIHFVKNIDNFMELYNFLFA